MWLTLLLNLLGGLLIEFIKNWLKNRSPEDLASQKEAFLIEVTRHPRWHKRKLEVASSLFDKAAHELRMHHTGTGDIFDLQAIVGQAAKAVKEEFEEN